MEKHFFYYNIYFSRFCYCHSVILFMYGIIMNFDLREEQQLLQKTVKGFTEQKINQRAKQMDREGDIYPSIQFTEADTGSNPEVLLTTAKPCYCR